MSSLRIGTTCISASDDAISVVCVCCKFRILENLFVCINLDRILIRAFDLVGARKYSNEPVIKVKFTLEQVMKAQTGSRGIAVLFL
jgi:hypothetical protein